MAAALRLGRWLRGLPPLLLAAGIVAALAGTLSVARIAMSPAAIPFPVPLYDIEATSGNCNASILNLGIGYVGSLEVPIPVDVDCDLLPDVLVAVNLVDIEGPINDPTATDSTTYEEFIADRLANTIAPNVEINRYPIDLLSSILQQPSPPVDISIVLTITDLEGEEPDTELRFGYDTGLGGSIPTHFKALVRGLDTFFNPLEAVVDTKGGFQGGDTVPAFYEGPLTLTGGITTDEGEFDAQFGLEYSPWPDVVRVGYASDDLGHHLDYEHGVGELLHLKYGTVLSDGTFEHYIPGVQPEIDTVTTLAVDDHGDELDVTAALDRMPRRMGVDINMGDTTGRLDFEATTDGRLPDARVDVVGRTQGVVTTRAEALIEELPPELHAVWELDGDDISALFATSDIDDPDFDLDDLGEGRGIGAIEVLYSNVEETSFAPHIPVEQQFANYQAIGGEQLMTARIERIRGMSFTSNDSGYDINARIGDGALPLETNIAIDGLGPAQQILDATATIAPLPSAIDISLFAGDDTTGDPFEVTYDASHTVDVDGRVELREAAAANAICGEPDTLCADLGIRHLPAHIALTIEETGEVGVGSTTDVAVDLVPRPGAPKPDVFVDAILGKQDSNDDPDAVGAAGPVLLEAQATMRGVPENVRLRFVEGADETLGELDVATCDLQVVATCAGVSDAIDSLEVLVRNFREEEREGAGVPHPSSVAPQFATVTARGLDDPDKEADPTVRFEAAARIKDIREVRYANVTGLFGVRSVIGDDRDLEVLLDIENVIFGDADPELGPLDLRTSALVSPLPGEINVCMREAGQLLTLGHDAAFTDLCESADPFEDGITAESPMTVAYDANTPFDLLAAIDFTSHGLLPGDEDNHDIHGSLNVTALPETLTAHIQMPPEVEEGEQTPDTERMRIRTVAPGATNTQLEFAFQDRLAGARCADPEPAGDITCIDGTISNLTDWFSVLVETGPGTDDIAAQAFACDLDIVTEDCRAGTDGVIEEITARARMVTGNPVEEGDLVPFVFEEHPYSDGFTEDTAHVLVLRLDQDDSDNLELRAQARLADFRSISFGKAADGFDVRTDLGDGIQPLLASIGMDTRFPASAVPADDCVDDPGTAEDECAQPEDGTLLLADTRVLPLPEVITISQHGPGDDQEQDPLEFSYESTAPVDIEAIAQIFGQVAGPLCGDHGTLCATLQLDRLPTEITAEVKQYDVSLGGADVRRIMDVDIDAIPFDGVDAPDILVDAMIGPDPDTSDPADHDDTPLIARADINGLTQQAFLRMAQVGELLENDALQDAELQEVLFLTCDVVPNSQPVECEEGTESDIREVGISVRNFHSRPTDFPVPTRTATPSEDPDDCATADVSPDPGDSDLMYAEAVMRSDDFEAHAGFTCIREFRFVSVDDVLGVTVNAGDGQGLEAHGDIAGIVLGDDAVITDADDPLDEWPANAVERKSLTLDALATFSNVPTELSFCMRTDGAAFPDQPIGQDATVPCEDQHPFSDPFFEAAPPEDGPMSVAYRANDQIDSIVTIADARIDRQVLVPVEILPGIEVLLPIGALPSMNIVGEVTIENLPEHLTFHMETPADNADNEAPVDEGGPIRALFYYDDSPSYGLGTELVNIEFGAEYTMGDAVCQDLREGQVAYCFSGRLENLPARVKAFIDPEAPLFVEGTSDLTKNLKIDTSGHGPDTLNLVDLDISVVKDDDPDSEPLILVATGDIIGLPQTITGTIHMPDATEGANDAPAFLVEASPPLQHLKDIEVRNFVAPDPLPDVADPWDGHGFEQQIAFIGRGDLFKAFADIRDVHSGGYLTGRNAAGEATDTQLISVGFGVPTTGPKPTIRGYVDMLNTDDDGNPTHIFGDIFLDDVPHKIDVCFRGEVDEVPTLDDFGGDQDALDEALAAYVDPLAAPGTQTHCDTWLENGDEVGLLRGLGGFQFQGDVAAGDPEPELDVDAIFRMTAGSDTNVLKAIAEVENIPNTIQGTFGDGAVSVEMFLSDGVTEASIDEVFVKMADFDFVPDGYGFNVPWGFRVPGNAPLPPVQPANQDGTGEAGHEYARVTANDDNFHVEARIGKDEDGDPGIRITKFIMDPSVCPTPANATSYFPHYPFVDDNGDGENDNEYLCIRGKLLNGQSSGSPLLLDADLVLDGTPLKVRDAGLTQVPGFFQVTVAETETVEGDNSALRRRCGPASTEGNATDCMPPLIHFDSTGDAQLFGRLLLGEGDDTNGDLGKLAGQGPYETMANLEASPVPLSVRPGGSDPWNEFPTATGVRAKIGQFQEEVDNGEEGGEERTAVRGAFRLNLPQALTIDQIQEWSYENRTSDSNFRSAKDLRFHYVMRDANGVIETAGDLAVMIHNFASGGQMLVSNVDNDTRGVPIPGEFGIDFYDRNYNGRGRHLLQADLRTSVDLGARVRLFHGAGDDLGDSDFKLRGVKGGSASLTDPDEPTFRLRAELKGEPEEVPEPGGGGGGDDGDDWKDALLCIVWCVATDIGPPQISADVDLAPDAGTPSRMLEAVISMKGAKIGAELQGYADVEGTTAARFSADSGNNGLNPLADGGLEVDIEPINIFFHVGVPILASFDALILSHGEVDLNIVPTENFRLKMNITAVRARDSNPFIESEIGEGSWLQVKLFPGFLQAYLSIFWPFPPIYLNYGITAGPIIPLVWHLCSPVYAAPLAPWMLPISSTELPVTGFLPPPLNIFPGGTLPSPLVTYGTLKPILDPVLWGLGPSILCGIFDMDGIDLFTDTQPHVEHTDRSPGDPIVHPDHPIPGLNISMPPPPGDAPDEPDDPLEDLLVEAGDTIELCGTQVFRNITVESGATINVASTASDDGTTPYLDCPADVDPGDVPDGQTPPPPNEGHLRLVAAGDPEEAGGGLVLDGTINAPAGGGELSISGENVTINGTVNASGGLLEINAGLDLTMSGAIDANYVSESMPTIADPSPEHEDIFGDPWDSLATGNAGAGHGSRGTVGTGANGGTRGDDYGSGVEDLDLFPGTEAGSPGGATRSTNDFTDTGNGGGAVVLRGSHITVDGSITANGRRGDDDSSGSCSVTVEDDPETEEDESSFTPNSGLQGTGGGSGGGIAVNGVTVDITDATLRARGGRGGDGKGGAGGAGGGGVIRVSAGLVTHDLDGADMDSAVRGGGAGFSNCDDDFVDSDAADDGIFEIIETPRSTAFGQTQFWFAGDDVSIPYRAALAGGDFNVYLCGIRRGVEATEEAGFGFVMPTGPPESGNPCGSVDEDGEHTPQLLATKHHGGEVADSTISPGSLSEGIWGLWTIASEDNAIFNGFCFPFFPFFEDCDFESTPESPQTTVGIDNSKPGFSMSPEGLSTNAAGDNVTNTRTVLLTLSGVTDQLVSDEEPPRFFDNMSGVRRFCIYLDNDGTLTRETCTSDMDQLSVDLPSTEREYTIYVVAFDEAGNTSSPLEEVPGPNLPDPDTFDNAHKLTVLLDQTPPAAGVGDITIPGTPSGENGWYLSPPTEYTISGYDDGANGSGQPAEGGFLYWFDGADPMPCVVDGSGDCVIDSQLPGEGTHTLNWRSQDSAGNVVPPLDEAPSSIPILIDSTAPQSAVTVIPTPEFTGQWITAAHPLAVARGVDAFGGSGFEPIPGGTDPDELCDGDPAGLSGTCISIDGPGGPFQYWDGEPIELPAGTGQVVCAYSVDAAGNVEAIDTDGNCTEPLNIDNVLPTGDIDVNPAIAAGDWYDFDLGTPAVTFDNYDGTGSPEPFLGGFRYRLDNGPEIPCADPCTIPTSELEAGSNVLHWTTVDTAGNRSPEQRVELLIDLDFPRTYVLPEPVTPTGSNDWYLERPAITLAGFDQPDPADPTAPPPLRPLESGIDEINYTIDGNPFTYAAPFHIEAGTHELCVVATDVAGNDEDESCQEFLVDLLPPNTSILQNGSTTPSPEGTNGWYTLPVDLTAEATDPSPGSLVTPQDTGPDLCDHTPDDDPAPAGICISVDGRAPGADINGPEFGPYTGAIELAEGVHVIRAFSVDNAGRRSAMEREIITVDLSDPVTVARLRAPHASRDGNLRPWWRHQPSLVLRGLDGDHNSGIDHIEYRINGGAVETYSEPVTLPVGINVVEHRAQDEAGQFGPWVREDVAVDVTPPFVEATSPDPMLWIQLKLLGIITFGGDTAELGWEISDDLSGEVHVKVIVFNELGAAIAQLDDGVHTVTPGQVLEGSTTWDGNSHYDVVEQIVPAGIYYYRVIATDDAGNVSMSGESSPLQVKLKLCLLFCR